MLLSGEDPGRIADARGRLVSLWAGPSAEAEMRIERLSGADLRRDGRGLGDALKAQGFFPGPRVVILEDATDGLAPVAEAALEDWREGDARLVVTAGSLPARGALRRLFEGRRGLVAITFYDDPPDAAELDALLAEAGVGSLEPEARALIETAAQSLPLFELCGLLERLALYGFGDTGPVAAEAVEALLPDGAEADLDALLAAVAAGEEARIPSILQRLSAQGVNGVAIATGLGRHLRAAMGVAAAKGGRDSALASLRPVPFGARRTALLRLASWAPERLENAAGLILELDRNLRGGSPAPQGALVERALLRLVRLGR
ncbi:DNA polymerase III subunit delta [Rubellimicrobium sp. CFH 75288]|uniref:DNA polymerase III subunit delta n=1 Tax=Rubellimicrobium sp. CFH 75288 TaxID=2697034 RepID=UPI0014127DCC|nr:DNA polymerase III subunit delta [Rubellimicrobium sp. CFH 75288]NAZ38040.1 DNA polymerase III subunit delta [Rubellimicrobium sp. CFH 75288]